MSSIIEKFSDISSFMGELFEFVQNNEKVTEDFSEYLKTLSVNNPSEKNLQGYLLTYIFERQLDNKTIFELYEQANNAFDNNLLIALKQTISGYFKIKKILKNGFVLYNLLNETEYEVVSLVKMTNFRGVYADQFINARIFCYENVFYLLEISDVYSHTVKPEIYRYLIAKMIQEPECAYQNSPKKEEIIKQNIQKTTNLFKSIFNTNEIITQNDQIDELLSILNEDFEKDAVNEIDVSKYIIAPKEYKYFKVSEFTSDYNNFLENSLGGFSSHTSTYDVGMIGDEKYGLYILPFWGTINKIFELGNLEQIEGGKDCVKYYIENDKIPLFVIEILNIKYHNFMELVNKSFEEEYTFEQLTDKYKNIYKTQTVYSPTSVLYTSKIFLETMGLLEKETNQSQINSIDYKNVARNDLCPCGSGKKYKNCCLNKQQ